MVDEQTQPRRPMNLGNGLREVSRTQNADLIGSHFAAIGASSHSLKCDPLHELRICEICQWS
jgi:hypothetical protein